MIISIVLDELPEAWEDLIVGLTLLSRGRANDVSPLHCEHDELTIMADPHKFTKAERIRLDKLGFFVEGHDADDSDGDEGLGKVEDCDGDCCEAVFKSFRFGSA